MTSPQEPSSQGPDIPDWLAQEQRNRVPRPLAPEGKQSRFSRVVEFARNHKGEIIAVPVLGAVALAAAAYLFSGADSGGRSPDNDTTYGVNKVEIDESITSVSLVEGANLRFDPYVSGPNDPINLVETLGEPMIIDSQNNDFSVIDGTPEGRWIGIPVEDIKRVDPQFDDRGDNNGIVWVNQTEGTDSIGYVDQGAK